MGQVLTLTLMPSHACVYAMSDISLPHTHVHIRRPTHCSADYHACTPPPVVQRFTRFDECAALMCGMREPCDAGVVCERHHVLGGDRVDEREHEVAHGALLDTDGVIRAEAGRRRQ